MNSHSKHVAQNICFIEKVNTQYLSLPLVKRMINRNIYINLSINKSTHECMKLQIKLTMNERKIGESNYHAYPKNS